MGIAIYLRKSRADMELEANGEMETLARHEKILLDVAKKQRLTITAIYKELVSGETISARPVMQQLIEEVENGKWDGVLVMEVERLARGDTIDQGIVARAFKSTNTKIITPLKTYDPSNEFDEEYFEFGLFMSRREYKTINRRIQRGRIQSAKDGKYLGSVPPYGYDKVRIDNDKGFTLKPNSEADTVRFIFDMYLKGNGCTIISNTLDKLNIKPRYNDHWSKASIADILKNPTYIGKIYWSKGNQEIFSDGLHPPIIENDIFNSVQEIRKQNTHPPIKADCTLQNPLTGIIFCKKCGSLMTRSGPNKHCDYDTIRCSNRYCSSVSAPIDLVEKNMLVELENWLKAYRVEVKNNSDENVQIESKKAAVKKMYSDINRIDAQIEKVYELLEQGVYTTEVFVSRNQILTKNKEDLTKAISELEQDILIDENAPKLNIQTVEKLLDTYTKLDSAEGKNQILKALLNKIEYEKDTPNHRGQRNNDNFKLIIYPKLTQAI